MSDECKLAILEALIQYGGSLSLKRLWETCCSRFTPENNVHSLLTSVDDLRVFLQSQPALFTLEHDVVHSALVYPNHIKIHHPRLNSHRSWEHQMSTSKADSELDTLLFLESQLSNKSKRFVSIKCLAHSLKKANINIQSFIRNYEELTCFIYRHPNSFVIRGDCVRLNSKNTCMKEVLLSAAGNFPKDITTPDAECSAVKNQIENLFVSPSFNFEKQVLSITVEECRSLLWILQFFDIIERNICAKSLLNQMLHAPQCVLQCVGRTQVEIFEFVNKFPQVMCYVSNSDTIRLLPTSHIALLLKENAWTKASSKILRKKGSVFCVNKLWGIIDLGAHEHVFFDRSLFKNVGDLSKHFKLQEIVYFNAVLAPKESRAKWRATCVWKECDQLANYFQQQNFSVMPDAQDDSDSGLECVDEYGPVRDLFKDVEHAFERCAPLFASIKLDESSRQAGLEFFGNDDQATQRLRGSLSMVDQHCLSGAQVDASDVSLCSERNTLSEVLSLPGLGDSSDCMSSSICTSGSFDRPRTSPCSNASVCGKRSVTTQTLCTGDIMATNLYHDE